ncbi:MAG TPA: hypothetical protein VGG33_12805 [Polyangia bacterium]
MAEGEKARARLAQTDNVRLSLPTEDDARAWTRPGFRIQLGYAFGRLYGQGPAWSFPSHALLVRPALRLSSAAAVGVTLLYGSGPRGLRWSVTPELTFHPWRGLALSAGAGFGGFEISDPNAPLGRLDRQTLMTSRELTRDEGLRGCSGMALSSVGRAEYLFVAGPLFASGPFLQAGLQWTECRETLELTEASAGRAVVLSQRWRHWGANGGWWFTWR